MAGEIRVVDAATLGGALGRDREPMLEAVLDGPEQGLDERLAVAVSHGRKLEHDPKVRRSLEGQAAVIDLALVGTDDRRDTRCRPRVL